MKARTPKFRLSAATITNITAGTLANQSLRATMNAEFSVKNANFWRYRYRSTRVEFFYREAKVAEVSVPESRAKWRSTREFAVDVDLNLVNGRISSDLRVGVVPITSSAQMEGTVGLIFVLKKNRSTHMSCSMEIAATQIRNIVCD